MSIAKSAARRLFTSTALAFGVRTKMKKARVKAMKKRHRIVYILVRGGVAYIARKPKDVDVIVKDFDNGAHE